MSDKNIDDLIVARTNEALENQNSQAPVQPVPEVSAIEDTPVSSETSETENNAPENSSNEPVVEEPKAESPSPIDEYGNPIEPERTYTESEVQRMIRERLARGKQSEQATNQEVKQVAQDFTADPNSNEDWQTQLEAFIDKTIEKKQQKQTEKQWQTEQQEIQSKFEEKFTIGMNRYNDFRDVVGKMPITDSIMLATRAMEDPAAFLYAASKMQPQELERIAKIRDPYQQATEIGKLDERMKKAKRSATNKGNPITPIKGDAVSSKPIGPNNIDARIAQHAKQKFQR